MFDPPPGFDDLIGDAEDGPSSKRWSPLDIPDVGVVTARKPRPNGIAWLAMAARPDNEPKVQRDYLMQFISHHVAAADIDDLQDRMTDPDGNVPFDAMERIARELATMGSARPYSAVINLAHYVGHHWRTVRHKLAMAGIADPMRMPSMHPILDVMEDLVLESKISADPDETIRQRKEFIDQLYAPAVNRTLNGDKYRPEKTPPPGFEPHEVNACFNAFQRQQGAQ